MCVFWSSCSTRRIIMEGSSDSAWQDSDSSRALNISGVSDRNPRLLRGERFGVRGDDSNDFELRKHSDGVELTHGDHLRNQGGLSGVCENEAAIDPFVHAIEWGDVSLRQWLDKPKRSVDVYECLHIFRQIVEIVYAAHSQGIVVHNVRPSCFVMSSFNHVSFIESASCSDSGSDSHEEGLNTQNMETKDLSSPLPLDMLQRRTRLRREDLQLVTAPTNDLSEASCMQSSSAYGTHVVLVEGMQEHKILDNRVNVEQVEEKKQPFPMKQILLMETNWYASPEELAGAPVSCASDIYRLGVLLFELFCPFSTGEEKTRTMSSLRHRVLPPQLLLKFPKEASFCLWLLHPEPSGRPKMGELLQSEFLNEPRDSMEEREAAIELREQIDEEELLLEFLLLVQQRKQESAKKLQDIVSFICSDIEEVSKQQAILRKKGGLGSFAELANDDLSGSKEGYSEGRRSGWINPFLEGLCKYLSFSKLRVKADLNQGDLLNSSNLVCSLSFDRDGELFAAAGVNKKIKVFECDAIINENRDIHYPVVEMASRSKLSSICWNSYIKSQIASSNFEGVVQVWDVSRSQVLTEMREHERRVWSIDFSSADPTLLASGSDDGSVKLWSINQAILLLHLVDGVSIGTIKTKANVCCVQFPLDSGRSLAFGSADHRIYYYDLRNSKIPLCTLIGHNKTVSYVKFVDATTLVSASTDNTLKLWDLSMCTSRVIDTPLHSFTGHTNVKNFVGLSVWDGYVATGSETNEVFVYHKAFPMPALSFNFNHADPLSGPETDDAAQFISSVCWRGQSSNTLVAANSSGNIKILEMV
ncbi:hypothetical protein CUMW_107360 [Citrus unshiu]|uniref:Protein kinase domain-containing protein n=1 Tax=Citrus unshiu TaxID=55188 RepID=A0A2H5P645_CITUN|nr:hypothetical protein CUMW_107360 [Citrus unshiu]GAY47840.1 hypothetical protein CUMW_107360 [Citrus unshiu]